MAIRAAFLLSISYLLGAFVHTPWQLFWVRVFQGLSAGLWPAQLAIMSASVPHKKLGLCMGIMQAALTAGGVLGPLVGGLLAEYFGMRTTFIIAGSALGCITILLVVVIQEAPRQKSERDTNTSSSQQNVLKISAVQRMLFAAGIVQLTILMTQPILPLYIAELQGSIGQDCSHLGDRFFNCRHLRRHSQSAMGNIRSVVGIPPCSVFKSFAVWYLRHHSGHTSGSRLVHRITICWWLAFAGIFPAINAVLTQSTDPSDRGKVFGYSYAAQQFGSVIGPIIGGCLATLAGNQITLAVSGALLLPLAVMLYFCRPKNVQAATGTPMDHK